MTKNHIDYLANLEQARHNRISESQNAVNLQISQQQADTAKYNAKTNRLQYKADKAYKQKSAKASLIQAKASKSQAKSAKKQAAAAAVQAKASTAQAEAAKTQAAASWMNANTNAQSAQWLRDYQQATIKVEEAKNEINYTYNDRWLDQKQLELQKLLKKYDVENALTRAKTKTEAVNKITKFSDALNRWYESYIKQGELRVKEGKLEVDKYNAVTQNVAAQYKALNDVTKSFKNLAQGLGAIGGVVSGAGSFASDSAGSMTKNATHKKTQSRSSGSKKKSNKKGKK